jgi:omega-3 fatty acid desaturase (delta-15 desaturase)
MPSGLAQLPEVVASKDASLRSRKSDGSGKENSKEGSKYIQKVSSAAEVHDPRLSLDGIRKALPKSVFVKSLRRSIQWMLFDYLMVAASFFISHRIYAMNLAEILGPDFALSCFLLPLLKIAMLIPCYMVCGFFMWGLFVVGHDCGHGSFSTSENYNFFFGLLTHGSILVPFTPWQRSHRFHHLKHNHVTDDYSYPWKHDPKYDVLTEPEKWHAQQPAILSVVYPIVAYAFYLVMPKTPWGVDGSHYMPALFKGDRMWKGIEWPELMRSWVSVAVCIGYVWLFATHVFRGNGVF